MSRRDLDRHPFFRPWDVLLAAIAVLFALIGVDVLLSFYWTPRVVPLASGEAYYYPWRAVWLVAAAGVVLVAFGLIVGMERQFHNWIVIGVGAGLLTLGTSYVATERVTVTSEELAARRWWGLESHTWRYDDAETITIVSHRGSKGARWVTVRVQPKGGWEGRLAEAGTPRLLEQAQFTLRQHAAAKGVAVTAVHQFR